MNGGITTPFNVAEWLPSDEALLDEWLQGLIDKLNDKSGTDSEGDKAPPNFHPPVQQLKELIEKEPTINMLFSQMFAEVPSQPPASEKTEKRQPLVKDYHMMLRLLNVVLTKAPEFNLLGLLVVQVNAVLHHCMCTPSGHALFMIDTVNSCFRKILDSWGEFLRSPDSVYVLNSDPRKGWLGEDAMKAMPDFFRTYKCDAAKPHCGFASWDDFFTRELVVGARPVASPGDDGVVVNACEASPYRIHRDVKQTDTFWIKSHPYAVAFMLANDALAEEFVGGTVYHAFLDTMYYHRWHSPVDGTIIKAYTVSGFYYALTPSSTKSIKFSLGYTAMVASRALLFIQADNPRIGMMVFAGVGLSDVSTCEITVRAGQRVRKGDQTGMFHVGGSSYCLIFRPGVEVDFDLHGQSLGLHAAPIPVNAKIASV